MSNEDLEDNLKVSHVQINQKEQNSSDLIDNLVKESCWTVKLNQKYASKLKPFMRPRLKQVAKFVCMGIR